jgi:Fe-S-cluster containining protein
MIQYDVSMSEQPFYAQGLRFSCARCSCCCRHESGYVYLSENDLSRLAKEMGKEYNDFIETWCRWVPLDQRWERLSLKEKPGFDCIFWSDKDGNTGCSVYNARPLQCRAFPFWDSTVCSPSAWETAGTGCPGINNGDLHTREKIESFLRLLEEELIIGRRIPQNGAVPE